MDETTNKPSVADGSRFHTAKEWERQRKTFQRLYVTEDKPLGQVVEEMYQVHGFQATYVTSFRIKLEVHSPCSLIPNPPRSTVNTTKPFLTFSSKRQYKRKIAAWHLDKNIKDEEMRAMLWMQRKRKATEGKDSHFYVRGRRVDPRKMARYARRKKTPQDLGTPPCSKFIY